MKHWLWRHRKTVTSYYLRRLISYEVIYFDVVIMWLHANDVIGKFSQWGTKTPLNADKSKRPAPILLKIELHFFMINISHKFRYNPSTSFFSYFGHKHTDTTDNITFARNGWQSLCKLYRFTLFKVISLVHFVRDYYIN